MRNQRKEFSFNISMDILCLFIQVVVFFVYIIMKQRQVNLLQDHLLTIAYVFIVIITARGKSLE